MTRVDRRQWGVNDIMMSRRELSSECREVSLAYIRFRLSYKSILFSLNMLAVLGISVFVHLCIAVFLHSCIPVFNSRFSTLLYLGLRQTYKSRVHVYGARSFQALGDINPLYPKLSDTFSYPILILIHTGNRNYVQWLLYCTLFYAI